MGAAVFTNVTVTGLNFAAEMLNGIHYEHYGPSVEPHQGLEAILNRVMRGEQREAKSKIRAKR